MPPIISKLLAGGLSAAVVLLWYPLFFPTDSIESWLIRGVVITLIFEILVHSLAPLETALWETARARRVLARAERTERPLRSRSLLAVCALGVPVALMAIAPPHPLTHPAGQRTAVRHVTEVKRVVKVERRTVAMAARPTTSGVQSGAATPEPAAGHYKPSKKHSASSTTRATSGSGKSSGPKHTSDNTSSDSTSTNDSADTTTDTTTTTPSTDSASPSTTAQPTTGGADTTTQPQQRVAARSRTA